MGMFTLLMLDGVPEIGAGLKTFLSALGSVHPIVLGWRRRP